MEVHVDRDPMLTICAGEECNPESMQSRDWWDGWRGNRVEEFVLGDDSLKGLVRNVT